MAIKIPDNWESFSFEEFFLRKSLLIAHVDSFNQNANYFEMVKKFNFYLSFKNLTRRLDNIYAIFFIFFSLYLTKQINRMHLKN